MSIEIQSNFYKTWPSFGVNLNSQWEDIRNNFASISTLIRSSYADLHPSDRTKNDLSHTVYGELAASKRFRVGYDKDTDFFVIQFNTGTQSIPVWVDYFRIRQSDGQVQAVGTGGFLSTNGFYNLNISGLEVKETLSGNKIFDSVSGITFNSSSGFYLTSDTDGNPIVNFVDVAGAVGETNTASNVGAGTGIFKTKAGVDLQFKTLLAGSNITLTPGTNDITIASTVSGSTEGFYGLNIKLTNNSKKFKNINTLNFEVSNFYLDQNSPNTDEVTIAFRGSSGSGSGEVNTASNLGIGSGVFAQKVGVDLQFKTLLAGSNISITPTSTDITIASTASGSGGGFYGVLFKESQSGGRVERDDTLIFDSRAGFYLTQAGNDGKPLLSLGDYVSSVSSRTIGDADLIFSDVATGSKHAITLKKLTAGRNIGFYLSDNQITVHTKDTLILGAESSASNLAIYPVDNPDTGLAFTETGGLDRVEIYAGGVGFTIAQAISNGYFAARRLSIVVSSVAAPGVTFSSDPDTGIHFSNANSMEFVTGGVTRVIVGQAGTNYNLDVRGPARVEDKLVAGGFYLEGAGEVPKKVAQSFNSSVEWTFNHNLNTRDIVWSVYDNSRNSIIPGDVSVGNPNTAFFYFTTAQAGRAIIIG